jgi:hypothetical protein
MNDDDLAVAPAVYDLTMDHAFIIFAHLLLLVFRFVTTEDQSRFEAHH